MIIKLAAELATASITSPSLSYVGSPAELRSKWGVSWPVVYRQLTSREVDTGPPASIIS